MKKIDGRKLNTETQQQLRYAVIRLREKKMTYAAIAKILNISVAFVFYTYKKISVWWDKGYRNKKTSSRHYSQKKIIKFGRLIQLYQNNL